MPNFLNEGRVQQYGTMDANETARFEISCERRDGAAYAKQARLPVEYHVVSLSLYGYYIGGIN
ncbi:MAG TPA: hypothetical protein VGT03_03850 [Candidatus Acidoferrales bacterium]|nr:hypothetical protein [Candidatus Acidoferrales bacterium]